MSKPEPTIRVNVDVTNPGQFFACCGILELADRLWPGAEGWFEGGQFCCSAPGGSLRELLDALLQEAPDSLTNLPNGVEVKELIAPLCLNVEGVGKLTLDAWMMVKTDKGEVVAAANPPWNFWSGQQTSLRIWLALRQALLQQLNQRHVSIDENLFSQRVLLSGRFGFDPGAAWNALDVGFSPNEQRMEVASSPAVELLAAVGIQRFRPRMAADRATFHYATWTSPLAPSVAAAVVACGLLSHAGVCFRGRVNSRGSYAALGYSIPVPRSAL